MRRALTVASVTLLMGLATPPSTTSQPSANEVGPAPGAAAAPAFGGRYRLGLSFGASCPVKGPVVSIQVEVSESPVGARIEVDGRPSDSEDATVSRLVLLRQGDQLHGAVGVKSDLDVLGIGTMEGQRVWMQLMADGTATTASGGKVLASGRAFGDLQVSRPGDSSRDTLGSCTARDHGWSLEPF